MASALTNTVTVTVTVTVKGQASGVFLKVIVAVCDDSSKNRGSIHSRVCRLKMPP